MKYKLNYNKVGVDRNSVELTEDVANELIRLGFAEKATAKRTNKKKEPKTEGQSVTIDAPVIEATLSIFKED